MGKIISSSFLCFRQFNLQIIMKLSLLLSCDFIFNYFCTELKTGNDSLTPSNQELYKTILQGTSLKFSGFLVPLKKGNRLSLLLLQIIRFHQNYCGKPGSYQMMPKPLLLQTTLIYKLNFHKLTFQSQLYKGETNNIQIHINSGKMT
jgi:hypothetical protein